MMAITPMWVPMAEVVVKGMCAGALPFWRVAQRSMAAELFSTLTEAKNQLQRSQFGFTCHMCYPVLLPYVCTYLTSG